MFKFRLEPLLQHCRHIEESCQKALAASRRVLAVERRKLKAVKQENAQCLARIDQRQKQRHTPADVLPLYRYLERITIDLKRQRERVSAHQKEVRARFQQLLAAVKKRKTLEKLKDRQKSAYLKQQQRLQRHFMDEVGAQRHHLQTKDPL